MLKLATRWIFLRPVMLIYRLMHAILRAPQGRVSRWIVVTLLVMYGIVAWMIPRGDSLSLTAAETASVSHRYGLLSFEVQNFMDKWLHRVYTVAPWTDTGTADRERDLARYMEIVTPIRDAAFKVLEESSRDVIVPAVLAERQRTLDDLLDERDRLRDSVEEYLESAISAELVEVALNAVGGFIWPPVDFRIDNPPSVLVISPRDRINRSQTILIEPDISVTDMERIEKLLLEDYNLSAAIMRTGGLASYPNVIPSDRDLLPLLEVAAHEWVHAYLIFYPLGRSFFNGGAIVEINETLANIVGDEIGGDTWSRLTGNPAPVREPPPPFVPQGEPLESEPESGEFDFFRFMRDTRIRTDELLEADDIEEAEAWMEQRRVELQENGFFIRKINQAFFAFNGSYGDSPSSASPTAHQIWELRLQAEDAGSLLKAIRGVSSYSEFEELLNARGITTGR
jgi:hypothetical protein